LKKSGKSGQARYRSAAGWPGAPPGRALLLPSSVVAAGLREA
jgi:hypothetical protein